MKKQLDFSLLDVCIVDDEAFIQKLIKSILMSLDVKQIRIASNGGEGYGLLEAKAADLIIIDWTMAPMTGVDLVRKIRASDNKIITETPAIMLTAHSERDYVEKAIKAGANDYLVKPISPKLLQQRIEGIFKSRVPLSHQEAATGRPKPPAPNKDSEEADDFLEFTIEEKEEEANPPLSKTSAG